MVTITKSLHEMNAVLDRYFLYVDDEWDFLHHIIRNLIEKYNAVWTESCEVHITEEDYKKLDSSTMITVKRLLRSMGIPVKEASTQEADNFRKMIILL